jgi:phospholipid/cholesterol/gamma-HCH transport system substrate-binding protein
MPRKRKSRIRLGLFVTMGTALFIIGIYLIGRNKNLFGDTIELSCVTDNVSGLLPGGSVRYSGINIGTVQDIVIVRDTVVRIDMVIEKNMQRFIKKDSKAMIGSEGLMGNKLVNILPGSPAVPSVSNGDLLLTTQPLDFDEILTSVQRTGHNVEHITTDLAFLIHNISHGKGTMGKILTDSAFAETLQQSMINIERGTEGFSENMEALKGNFLLRNYYKKKEKQQDKQQEEEDQKRDRKKKKDRDKNEDK